MWDWMFFSGMNSFWGLAVYTWFALCLYLIANKTGTPDAWLAWIPFANLYLMCRVAGLSGWWAILFFIPLVNLILVVVVWTNIARASNKPSWLGILMLIPLVNLVIPGVLAFSER